MIGIDLIERFVRTHAVRRKRRSAVNRKHCSERGVTIQEENVSA
jgi:hypothetical protein